MTDITRHHRHLAPPGGSATTAQARSRLRRALPLAALVLAGLLLGLLLCGVAHGQTTITPRGLILPVSIANGGTGATSFTAGSIPFVKSGTPAVLTQDNANLFWDATNLRLGIGTAAPGTFVTGGSRYLSLDATGANEQYPQVEFRGQVTIANGTIGRIDWVNKAGANNYDIARLQVEMDTGQQSGIISFWTIPNGGTLTKRLQIGENGNITTGARINLDVSGAAGGIGVPYHSGFFAADSTNTTNEFLIGMDTIAGFTNVIDIGSNTSAPIVLGNPGKISSNAYSLNFPQGSGIFFANAAGNAARAVIGLDGNNQVSIATSGDTSVIGSTTQFYGTGAAPVGGAGIEINGSTTPSIVAYNRGGAAYIGNNYDALSHTFKLSGTVGLTLTSNNAAFVGTLTATAIASNTGVQSGYLCYNTTAPGTITYDPTNTCLVSRETYKTDDGPISDALAIILALRPFWGSYKVDTPIPDHRQQPFLGAYQTASVDGRLVSYDPDGVPLGVRYQNLTAVLAAAIQEQQKQIDELRRRLQGTRESVAP